MVVQVGLRSIIKLVGEHFEDFVLVPHKGVLPRINSKIPVASALSDKLYELTVKKIIGIRWNKNGDLIVDVSGTKQEVYN